MTAPSLLDHPLFTPIRVGDCQLLHRIVLAPLARRRVTANDCIPLLPTVAEYYAQRASRPGTLLITESVSIAPEGGGMVHNPGVHSREQILAWREVTNAVHVNKCFIFCQLRAYGRAAEPAFLASSTPPLQFVGPSPIPLKSRPSTDPTPHALTIPEIKQFVALYADGAKKAVDEANFDGVEIHGANGYLIDQFLQDVSNQRTDEYGGSVEGRTRFALEVIEAVVKAIGAKRVGIRLSPWSPFLEMGMKDPKPTFSYLVTQLRERFPDIAFLHLIEPRVNGTVIDALTDENKDQSNDFLREIWGDRTFISAGGYTRSTALQRTQQRRNELIAFGRRYISNPDLPNRLLYDVPLSPYDRTTFYSAGDTSGRGYTDYPFATQSYR